MIELSNDGRSLAVSTKDNVIMLNSVSWKDLTKVKELQSVLLEKYIHAEGYVGDLFSSDSQVVNVCNQVLDLLNKASDTTLSLDDLEIQDITNLFFTNRIKTTDDLTPSLLCELHNFNFFLMLNQKIKEKKEVLEKQTKSKKQ